MLNRPETVGIQSIVVVDARNQPDWAFPLHSHEDEVEFSLVQAGGGTFYCEGRSYAMHPGDVIIKNAGIIHAEQTSRDQPIRQICISFSGIQELPGLPNHLLPAYGSPVLPCGEDFEILNALFSYLAAHGREEGQETTVRHLMLAALEIIIRRIDQRKKTAKENIRDSKTMQTVTNVMEWINQHYQQKITLNALSERFFISSYYLDKKFKACTGYSINQYVIDRRMGEAQRMLIFEQTSIKEIALAVGYDNLQYFYATFKKYTGKSPAVFREEFRQGNAAVSSV